MEIRFAQITDANQVCGLLHSEMNDEISLAHWQRLFHYAWFSQAKPDYGVVAVENGKIVGFIGNIFSERMIEGKPRTFCNISSIYVAKELRGRGLGRKLMETAISRENIHYLALSAAAQMAPAYRRIGLVTMDEERCVIPVNPGAAPLPALTDAEKIAREAADAETRRIARDHLPYSCRQLLLRQNGRELYVLLKDFTSKRGTRYAEILHATDFAWIAHEPELAAATLALPGQAQICFDTRFLPRAGRAGEVRGIRREPLPAARMYSVKGEAPLSFAAYDSAYSEIILLDMRI